MKRLWAPWRLEWVKRDKNALSNSCPFCDLTEQTPSDQNLVFYSDSDIFVVLNLYPFGVGHLLIIPKAHVEFPSDLPPGVWLKLAKAQAACIEILQKCYKPQGFNLGINLGAAGGAGLPKHLHWHAIPRWTGDVNFMPALAEVKVLPSHRDHMYRELKPFFDTFADQI